MESEQINNLLQQLSLDEELQALLIQRVRPDKKKHGADEDISDWSTSMQPAYHNQAMMTQTHIRSRSMFQTRLERLSLPRIASSLASQKSQEPAKASSQRVNRKEPWQEHFSSKRQLKSYEETVLAQRTSLAFLRSRKQQQTPVMPMTKVPQYSLEKYKAMCSHLRQPDNTELYMKRLENGISMVEQLNRLRSKSILDEDVQKGSSIVVNHAHLPHKISHHRQRKQLRVAYQSPQKWIA